MKKGGYQILELNCESDVNVYDDYGTNDLVWVNVIKDFNNKSCNIYLRNLFMYNKICLVKNLLVVGIYLTFFTHMVTGTYLDKYSNDEIIYVINSSQANGYESLSIEDYFYCMINDDYVLLIDYESSTAIITKIYKGAIT